MTTTNRKKKASPTQRALADLRSMGFLPAVVEKWNPHVKQRLDLYGCIDVLAVRDGIGILGVQATTRDHHSHRRVKALAEPRLRRWLSAGGRFEIWSYAQPGGFGERWKLRREELTLADLPADPGLPLFGGSK